MAYGFLITNSNATEAPIISNLRLSELCNFLDREKSMVRINACMRKEIEEKCNTISLVIRMEPDNTEDCIILKARVLS